MVRHERTFEKKGLVRPSLKPMDYSTTLLPNRRSFDPSVNLEPRPPSTRSTTTFPTLSRVPRTHRDFVHDERVEFMVGTKRGLTTLLVFNEDLILFMVLDVEFRVSYVLLILFVEALLLLWFSVRDLLD